MSRVVLALCFLVIFAYAKQTVVVEAFDWDSLSNRTAQYQKIQSAASGLAAAGVTYVWFPPPSQSADEEGYMPGEYYNIVGSSTLLSAINTVISTGMQPIMDTVLNHRTATYKSTCDGNWNNFTDPNWGTWAVVKDDYYCYSNSQMYCYSNDCSCGNADTGENFCSAPDVDHTNTGIQSDIVSWMQSMQSNYKFVGWRFDMVIGYGGSYVGHYISSTSTAFSVGEYWTDDTDQIVSWIEATGYKSTAFDFPGRDNLQTCVDSNNYSNMLWGISPPGLMGAEPAYASTFTDNHDTARDDKFGTTDQIIQGYAYILTHPGTPFIFWDDWETSEIQTAIKTLISIRNNQNLTPTQNIYVTNHEAGLYSVFLGGATADCGGNTCMKLGTASWDPDYCGSGWSLATSGSNYAIWVK